MSEKSDLRIAFAGTPDIAAIILQRLLDAGITPIAAYTQPDKPAGRGRKLQQSAVKVLAMENDIPVYQPQTLRDSRAQQTLEDLKPDLMIVIAYGLILPQEVLDIPTYGCMNIHASLLPRWRGAAPIQRAILEGDETTGITIMQMDAGLDTGDMLVKEEVAIAPDETSSSLHHKLAQAGGKAMLAALNLLKANKLQPKQQDDTLASYAHKIEKSEGEIDWQQSAEAIERMLRAFQPWPVAYSHIAGERVRIFSADIIASSCVEAPGTLVEFSKNGLKVATGEGYLNITQLQLAGGKPLNVSQLVNAPPKVLTPGACFDAKSCRD